MKRRFNVTGSCSPQRHYMVRLDDREELKGPLTEIMERDGNSLKDLFVRLSRMCRNNAQPIVLMIDEVDSAGNNQVFIASKT